MKKLIVFLVLSLVSLTGMAEGVHLEKANIDLHDKAALQRGAKYFFNYCAGCHSLKYARYNRMAKDIGLTDKQVKKNLMFMAGTKVGDNINVSMRPKDGEAWFGTPIPDLTLVTRNKVGGPDWVYTYLKSFYVDPTRPWGVNNVVFPNVGMPDVLAGVQGLQEAVYKEGENAAGQAEKVFDHLKLTKKGSMTPEQFDGMVRDLTTFLAYMGEPVKLQRQHMGIYVILFLVVFTVIAYLLKKEYWRDVH